MNLTKLFNMQRELDEHIEREHPRVEGEDRLAKKVLALQVELGELANEWRGFKFWSKNQMPCTYRREHDFFSDAIVREYNPLLEEYVDCLHFILSIGNEIACSATIAQVHADLVPLFTTDHVVSQFNKILFETPKILHNLAFLEREEDESMKWATKRTIKSNYNTALRDFIVLGVMLGFTWEQIEQAYIEKNETNHARQESGY